MGSPLTCPGAAAWWPSCPLSASAVATARPLLSPWVATAAEAPPSMHFLVQAAAPALAPLAPHLESLTQPLTVWALPMSSAATTATSRNNTERAIQMISSFFMAEFLDFWRPVAADCSNAPLRAFLCYLD